jgi:hypothetical protein
MPTFTIHDLSVVVSACKTGEPQESCAPACSPAGCTSASLGQKIHVCQDELSQKSGDVMGSSLAGDLATLKEHLTQARNRAAQVIDGLERAIAACDEGIQKKTGP